MVIKKSYWHSKYYGKNLYLNTLKQFFIKQGKKSILESKFKEYMINPSIKKTLGWNKKTESKFIKCEQNSTPYVKLLLRKRGKRVKYKVTYLQQESRLKKAVLPFSKLVKERKMNSFLISFDKEIENLSAGRSQVMVKRDELHQLAFSKAPYSWKKKRKQVKAKKKIKNFLLYQNKTNNDFLTQIKPELNKTYDIFIKE